MPDYNCLYCGSEDIHQLADNEAVCRRCGLLLTKPEIDKAREYAQKKEPDGTKSEDGIYETEILASAWELMRKEAWDKALEILFPPSSPAEYPLEFSVYRGICSTARLQGLEELGSRYYHLDALLQNIKCLGYYLPADDGRDHYPTLQRLHQALLLLGGIQLPNLTSLEVRTENTYIPAFADHTNQKRADILEYFAGHLQSKRYENDRRRTEYLKMAVDLLHRCLEFSQEHHNRPLFSAEDERVLQISPETRRRIKSKIQLLNEEISSRDPQFIPRRPLPDPKFISGRFYLGGMLLTIILVSAFLLVLFFGSHSLINSVFGLLISKEFITAIIAGTAIVFTAVYFYHSS